MMYNFSHERREKRRSWPAFPLIEYQYGEATMLPFRIRLDPEKLYEFLKSDFNLGDEQIRQSRFTVTEEIDEIGPAETSMHIIVGQGSTDYKRGTDGRRNIKIKFGSIFEVVHNVKSYAFVYCMLSKQEELSPAYEEGKRQVGEVLGDHFKTRRMLPYLAQVDWQRASSFIDLIEKRKLMKEVSSTLIHESTHLKDLDEVERLRGNSKRDKKKLFIAIGSDVIAIAGFVGIKVANMPSGYNLIPVGLAIVAVGAAVYTTLRLYRNKAYSEKIMNSAEDNARETAKNANITKWLDVVKLEPNPNFSAEVNP